MSVKTLPPLKMLIEADGVSRDVPFPFEICASRATLEWLALCIETELNRSTEPFSHGRVQVPTPLRTVVYDAEPLAWADAATPTIEPLLTNDVEWLLRLVSDPKYAALVLAGSHARLKEWVSAATPYMRASGAHFRGNPKEFHFQSGARIYTGHIEASARNDMYRGHEYQNILLVNGQFTETTKRMLMGSCRQTVSGVAPEFRIGTGAKLT